MAVPVVVIKAIAVAATDKRVWKVIAVIITALLMPIIIVILMICALVSETESANQSLLDYSFKGASISQDFTDEQRDAIENMQIGLRNWTRRLKKMKAITALTGIWSGLFFTVCNSARISCTLTHLQNPTKKQRLLSALTWDVNFPYCNAENQSFTNREFLYLPQPFPKHKIKPYNIAEKDS